MASPAVAVDTMHAALVSAVVVVVVVIIGGADDSCNRVFAIAGRSVGRPRLGATGATGTNRGMLLVESCRHGTSTGMGLNLEHLVQHRNGIFGGAGIVVCRSGVVVVVCLSTASNTVNDHTHTHVQ